MLTNYNVVIMLLIAIVTVVTCSEVTISNVIPRRDTAGNIIDAHDGSIFLYDGLYYYYGPSYGLCQEPPGPSGCTAWHPGVVVSNSIIMLAFILRRIYPCGHFVDTSFKCLH
jgi:hypothetical protein